MHCHVHSLLQQNPRWISKPNLHVFAAQGQQPKSNQSTQLKIDQVLIWCETVEVTQ